MRRVAFGVAMLLPGTAAAVNGTTPRTPPSFGEPPCMTVVDRSVDPVLHVELGLPYEDAILTGDELSDSRTLQVFAACRPEREGDRLPMWITTDDGERALAAMLVGELPATDDVLATASAWASGHAPGSPCVLPLVAADARLPLTCDAVESGVDWDTTSAPAGVYAIYGYTFEPAANLWTRRRGTVLVLDDANDPPPAVALLAPQGQPNTYEQSTVVISGCAVGPDDTTVVLAWAPITADDLGDESAWTPIAELAAAPQVAGFDVDFDPPPAAAGQAVVVRARAQDATGRAWTDVAAGTLIVLPGAGRSDPPEGQPLPDACNSAAGSSEGGTTAPSDSSGSDDAGAASTSTGACGCDANRGRVAPMWLVLALGLRRRARCAKVGRPCTGASSCVTDGSGWCSRTTGSSWSSRSC